MVHTLNPALRRQIRLPLSGKAVYTELPDSRSHIVRHCQKHTHQNCKDVFSKLSVGDEPIYDNVKY